MASSSVDHKIGSPALNRLVMPARLPCITACTGSTAVRRPVELRRRFADSSLQLLRCKVGVILLASVSLSCCDTRRTSACEDASAQSRTRALETMDGAAAEALVSIQDAPTLYAHPLALQAEPSAAPPQPAMADDGLVVKKRKGTELACSSCKLRRVRCVAVPGSDSCKACTKVRAPALLH